MPNWLDFNSQTIPKMLKRAGYHTAHYGKWHLGGGGGQHGHPDAPLPTAYGFDDSRVWNGNGPTWVGLEKWPFAVCNDDDEVFLPHPDSLAVNEAISFIEQHRDGPFYVLSENGYLEDAWRLITREAYPSIGYMIQQEATTIWERFELKKNPGMNSHNHPMYGAVDYWFYAYLCGIRPLDPGYARILIKPFIPEGLMSAQATVDTVRGEVSVRWMKRYGALHIHVNVPFGTCAVVKFAGEKYEVGSGFYTFSVPFQGV